MVRSRDWPVGKPIGKPIGGPKPLFPFRRLLVAPRLDRGSSKLSTRKKVLICAPHVDQHDVGEPRSAFHWVSKLSERCDVTLLTYKLRKSRSTVPQLPNTRVVEWNDLPLVGRFDRFNAAVKPGYLPFYFRARRWIASALRDGEAWDLAHQLTPLAVRFPSPATGLIRPLIVGPIAGSLKTPEGFEAEFSGDPLFMRLRNMDGFRLRHDRSLRRTYQQCDALVGVAPYVDSLLEQHGIRTRRFEVMSEVGVDEVPEQTHAPGDVMRLLFVGRVVRTKGVRDAIRAMALVKDLRNVRLDIIGEGFDSKACKEEASALGLDDSVCFHGRLPRDAVRDWYRQADVFLFPSLREPSGNVVIEAMSAGLAMIAADRGGPGYVVTDACGIRVPVTDPQSFAASLAGAIRELHDDPEKRAEMSHAAQRRVRELALWENKIEWMTGLYDDVCARSSFHSDDDRRMSASSSQAAGASHPL